MGSKAAKSRGRMKRIDRTTRGSRREKLKRGGMMEGNKCRSVFVRGKKEHTKSTLLDIALYAGRLISKSSDLAENLMSQKQQSNK